MTANVLLFKITLLTYFAATIFYLIGVISRKESVRLAAIWLLSGGFALHCPGGPLVRNRHHACSQPL